MSDACFDSRRSVRTSHCRAASEMDILEHVRSHRMLSWRASTFAFRNSSLSTSSRLPIFAATVDRSLLGEPGLTPPKLLFKDGRLLEPARRNDRHLAPAANDPRARPSSSWHLLRRDLHRDSRAMITPIGISTFSSPGSASVSSSPVSNLLEREPGVFDSSRSRESPSS